MPQSPYQHPIEVRFRDLDGLGHINNAVYLTYVELCRTRWFESVGLADLSDMVKGFPLILARTTIDFLQQGKMSDRLHVACWIKSIGTKSFVQAYEVVKTGGSVLAKVEAVLVWFDFIKNCSTPIPANARHILEKHLRP